MIKLAEGGVSFFFFFRESGLIKGVGFSFLI